MSSLESYYIMVSTYERNQNGHIWNLVECERLFFHCLLTPSRMFNMRCVRTCRERESYLLVYVNIATWNAGEALTFLQIGLSRDLSLLVKFEAVMTVTFVLWDVTLCDLVGSWTVDTTAAIAKHGQNGTERGGKGAEHTSRSDQNTERMWDP
jgi:hypothetical protein